MIRARLIFAAATITVAATVANHWPRPHLADIYPPPSWHAPFGMECGPGPRVLIVGASVALGWGVDRVEDTWWARLCRITGGQYINLSVPATRVADHLEVLRGITAAERFDRTLVVAGANDAVLGLAPGVAGQVDRRRVQFAADARAVRYVVNGSWLTPNGNIPAPRGRLRLILQPAPQGYGEEVRRAYHEMAREVDLDLSALPVDYVDRIHFGRAGQASLARAIAEAL